MSSVLNEHIRILDLSASLITSGPGASLVLAVRYVTLEMHRTGIEALANHFLPGQRIQVEIVDSSDVEDAEFRVCGQRWGMSAVLFASLRPDLALPGTLQISLRAGSKWSPLDQTVLGLIDTRLRRVSETQPQLVRAGPRTYRFDVRSFLDLQIAGSGVPVRWDAQLQEIETGSDRVRIRFERITTA